MSPRRQQLADVVGLLVVVAVRLDLLRPSLLLLPTIAAGGDTPCHYPTAVWLKERLLPQLRLHGWYPGNYLGQPLLLYYFPFPFLLMAGLASFVGMPAAFKLGTALGVFLLPLLAYLSLRRMRMPFPAPLLGAAGALVFLYVEDNPIWGGTIASTLTGEFSYTYGIGLAVLFLGELLRAREDGRGPWLPAVLLGLTSYAHGYAVLWAGLSASGLLLWDRRPLRCLGWLAAVAALAFAFAAPSLLPLLAAWGWTTPYDDAWIEVTTRNLLPWLLQPLAVLALAGIVWTLLERLRGSEPDRRLLLLAWAAVAGAALACAGPSLGVIDVRFVPFTQLALALGGSAAVGLLLSRFALGDVAALGLTLVAVVWSDGSSRVLRQWIDWNYSGLEAKELWPAWRELCDRLHGGVGDPRVAVEYDPLHERAGSLRMYEMLPFFSGRSTLEGVYNQASTVTHPVFYLASELFARSPNPFRSRSYSRFDPETAFGRLRLFNVGQIVATSPALRAWLDKRKDVVLEASIPPYALYRLLDPGPGYVEPLAYEPVRARRAGWRDQCYRWFSRKPPNRAALVFSDDPSFTLAQVDPWTPPPERPLAADVHVKATVEAESVRIETDRPGHPLLVKISYHPRWRCDGAAGPYLVSPGLMLIVPRQREVRLYYQARTAADYAGMVLALAAAGTLGAALVPLGRRRAPEPALGEPSFAPRWLPRMAPVLIVAALSALRLLPGPAPSPRVQVLSARASRALAEGRFEDAAELARGALSFLQGAEPQRPSLLCLLGEALLDVGHPREAAQSFALALETPGAEQAKALYLGARAREADGDAEGASAWRRQLRRGYAETPWAERLARDEAQATR